MASVNTGLTQVPPTSEPLRAARIANAQSWVPRPPSPAFRGIPSSCLQTSRTGATERRPASGCSIQGRVAQVQVGAGHAGMVDEFDLLAGDGLVGGPILRRQCR